MVRFTSSRVRAALLSLLCVSRFEFANSSARGAEKSEGERTTDAKEEFRLSERAICVPNPPSEHRCQLTPEIVIWLTRTSGEKLGFLELPDKEQNKAFANMRDSPCIGDGRQSFPALHRTHGYDYHICTFQIRHFEESDGDDHLRRFMIFSPDDDQDKIAECDILPWLMRLTTKGRGLAVDIGAGSTGDCSWPLLTENHTVHMFESGYQDSHESAFVQLTIDVNGWQDRAHLHTGVEADDYIANLFSEEEKIELIKVDVDHNESYEAVFEAIEPLLFKTEIVQVELITEEIGVRNKRQVLDRFQVRGFDMFGLEDVETFPGFSHESLSEDGDWPSKLHSDAVSRSEADYIYGSDGLQHIRMFPICACPGVKGAGKGAGTVGRGKATRNPLRSGFQFVFVRRDSETMREVVARGYGSCADTCARATSNSEL